MYPRLLHLDRTKADHSCLYWHAVRSIPRDDGSDTSGSPAKSTTIKVVASCILWPPVCDFLCAHGSCAPPGLAFGVSGPMRKLGGRCHLKNIAADTWTCCTSRIAVYDQDARTGHGQACTSLKTDNSMSPYHFSASNWNTFSAAGPFQGLVCATLPALQLVLALPLKPAHECT